MGPENGVEKPFNFTEEQIQCLREKYSKEMKDDESNPIKLCIKLIFDAAIEKDPVKRLKLSYDLSEFLTKPDGIINLALSLIDFDTSSQKVTTHNQRFIAVSRIITCLPRLCMPYENYCDNIARQLKPMILHDNHIYSNLASIIYKSMLDSPHARKKNIAQIILGPILDALKRPSEKQPFMKPPEAIVAINNLLSNHIPVELFVETFANLFYALAALYGTPSYLVIILKSCLTQILDGIKPGAACCLIERSLFNQTSLNGSFSVVAGDDGLNLEFNEPKSVSKLKDIDMERFINILVQLLEQSNSEMFLLEFFFYFQEIMRTTRDEDIRNWTVALIEPFLTQSIEEEPTKLNMLDIIAKNSNRSLELISRCLLGYLTSLRDGKSAETVEFKRMMGSLSSCLSILDLLSTATPLNDELEIVFRNCLNLVTDLHSLIMAERSDQERSSCQETETVVIKLSQLKDTLSEKLEKSNSTERIYDESNDDEINEVLKDLNDKLVPVRVHAIVRLKQMIMAHDKYIISQIPRLYNMIESSLADSEPYVFLASINLVVEMAMRNTSYLLPKLIELHTSQDLDIQQRINVGEALVRLVRQMKETTPYYAQQVMSAMFFGCKSPDELIRMSSLSNIGDICKNLGDSLGKYIVEVLEFVKSGIGDESMQVRCSAVNLLVTLLSGLDVYKIETIQREMKAIYNLLKQLRARTLDDQLCLQIDLALDEIDRLAREMLNGVDVTRGKQLTKNIKILSLLD